MAVFQGKDYKRCDWNAESYLHRIWMEASADREYLFSNAVSCDSGIVVINFIIIYGRYT